MASGERLSGFAPWGVDRRRPLGIWQRSTSKLSETTPKSSSGRGMLERQGLRQVAASEAQGLTWDRIPDNPDARCEGSSEALRERVSRMDPTTATLEVVAATSVAGDGADTALRVMRGVRTTQRRIESDRAAADHAAIKEYRESCAARIQLAAAAIAAMCPPEKLEVTPACHSDIYIAKSPANADVKDIVSWMAAHPQATQLGTSMDALWSNLHKMKLDADCE